MVENPTLEAKVITKPDTTVIIQVELTPIQAAGICLALQKSKRHVIFGLMWEAMLRNLVPTLYAALPARSR